jgi:HTH-type transcriptional regulator/antitoxin HipB
VLIHDTVEMSAAVRRRRRELGQSQATVARRAGVSRKWIYEFEAGKASAEFGLVVRVLAALELSLDVSGVSEMARYPT